MTLPRLALSVRQPWAWAIVEGHKPVENRQWKRPNPGLNFRGDVAIHASKGMIRREYEEAAAFMEEMGITCPSPGELLRGGIVGSAIVTDIVTLHDSRWFFGRIGLVLAGTAPSQFVACSGALGFFEWRPRRTETGPDAPARWMHSTTIKSSRGMAATPFQADLLAKLA